MIMAKSDAGSGAGAGADEMVAKAAGSCGAGSAMIWFDAGKSCNTKKDRMNCK